MSGAIPITTNNSHCVNAMAAPPTANGATNSGIHAKLNNIGPDRFKSILRSPCRFLSSARFLSCTAQ
eukprot:12924785-Prorocentrum_lima.AAC.1